MYAAPMKPCRSSAPVYRRQTSSKLPRKRNFLVQVSSRTPASLAQQPCAGGNGPSGPKGPETSRICCWGDDSGSSRGRGNGAAAPYALVACVAAAAVVGAANPGTAAAHEGQGRLLSTLSSLAGPYSGSEEEDMTPTGPGFTEDERELVVPRQYRVREWVYVH